MSDEKKSIRELMENLIDNMPQSEDAASMVGMYDLLGYSPIVSMVMFEQAAVICREILIDEWPFLPEDTREDLPLEEYRELIRKLKDACEAPALRTVASAIQLMASKKNPEDIH